MDKPTITLVGAGSLARALGPALVAAGYRVDEVVSRDGGPRSAARRGAPTAEGRALAKEVGATAVSMSAARFDADLVWLCVNDDSIGEVTRRLARRSPESAAESASKSMPARSTSKPVSQARAQGPAVAGARRGNPWAGKVVLHSSGALSSDELAPLRKAGARVASLHPMMTFVSMPGAAGTRAKAAMARRGSAKGGLAKGAVAKRVARGGPRSGTSGVMDGVAFAMEGDTAAVAVARRVASDLGGQPFRIRKSAKVLYHALGAFASPLVVALLSASEQVARAAGIPRAQAMEVMGPILRRTIENYLTAGAGAAFSGPIRRGDVETLRRHLEELRKVPEARKVYLALVECAMMSGELPVGNKNAVQGLVRLEK